MKIRVGIAAMVATILLFVGWASAQVAKLPRPVQSPVVLSGSDIGFRVEGQRGDAVTGTLVIRVDGKWIDAQMAGRTLRLSER